MEHTQDMTKKPPPPQGLRSVLCQAGAQIFDSNALLKSPERRNSVLRGMITTLVAYYIGVYLLGSSGIAPGTVAYGSARSPAPRCGRTSGVSRR